jgi:ribose transport system ATP-binding protein
MVFIGDELPEVIGLSNRIAVMRKGKIVDVLDAPADGKPSEIEIVNRMI